MAARVLIVETDVAYRHSLSGRLNRARGLAVEEANPDELEHLLQTKDFDVIIVGMNPFPQQKMAVMRRVKQKQPPAEIILMVGEDQLAASIQAMKEGVFDDILIPFDLETLLQKIRRAVRHRRRQQRRKRGFLDCCRGLQDVFVAATFAEAGEFEEARRITRKSRPRGSNQTKKRRHS